MKNLILTELMKLKRYNILMVSALGFIVSTAFGVFQALHSSSGEIQSIVFSEFAEQVTFNNMFLIGPFIITLIGGYIFKREYEEDTIKTLLMIPVSLSDLTAAKLIVVSISSIFLFLFGFVLMILTAFFVQAEGMIAESCIQYFIKFAIGGVTTFVAVLPILAVVITFNKGHFVSVIIAWFYGFIGLFAANNGVAGNLYPVSAGLRVVQSIGDETGKYNYVQCYLILMVVLICGVLILKIGAGLQRKLGTLKI